MRRLFTRYATASAVATLILSVGLPMARAGAGGAIAGRPTCTARGLCFDSPTVDASQVDDRRTLDKP